MPDSVWRRVRARVHLSLTPAELSNPVRAATNRAFSSLLMRYSPELGGAVVAHIGPVQLSGPPVFLGSSPFPHVAAIANLLVFAPTRGTQLLGVVTHVGPDHLGLSVLSAFHAVLPMDDLSHMYTFDADFSSSTPSPAWRHINGQDKITINRQIRFVISELKPTRSGLFQIIASLDHTLRDHPNDSHPLGLLPLEKQISLSSQPKQLQSDGVEAQYGDLPVINKRSTLLPENNSLTGDDLLTAGNDGFGDALMPMVMPPMSTPVSALKRKKRARDGTVRDLANFGESGQDIRKKYVPDERDATGSGDNMSIENTPRKVDDIEEGDDAVRETPGSQVDERSERKKRKREKKKKKKKRMSTNVEETRTPERGERARDEQDGATPLAKVDERKRLEAEGGSIERRVVKQEERTVEEEDVNARDSAHNGPELVQSARKDSKKRRKKKKKKKKRKETHDSTGAEALRLQQRQANGSHTGDGEEDDTVDRRREVRRDNETGVIKHEEKQTSGDETAVKKEMTVMRVEERTVDVGARGGEINTEDDKRAVSTGERGERHKKSKRDDDDHRKVKKKRKRSSEGEIDSGTKRKKKKHKKRLSLAIGSG